jgi:hypothetical protein
MSKDLSPMHPLLSTKDTDVVYLVLGEYQEDRFNFEFLPSIARYRIAVDMRNNIVRASITPEEEECHELISCGFSRYLRKALVGPCDDGGVPMKKRPRMKERRRDGENVAEAPVPMKKRPRRKKHRRCRDIGGLHRRAGKHLKKMD